MKKLEKLSLSNVISKLTRNEMRYVMAGSGTSGTATTSGDICSPHGPAGYWMHFDYGYDALRVDENGNSFTTYHNRTNFRDTCEQS